MKSLIQLYLYATGFLVVFMTALVVIAHYQAVLPWLVAIIVLVIVARIVWQRTNYY